MKLQEAKERGLYVEQLNGQSQLHSSINPHEEAQRRLPDSLPDHERFVIFGAGLGYVLHHLASRCDHPRVLVFEPNPQLLRKGTDRGIWNRDEFYQYYEINREDPRLMEALFQFIPMEVLDKFSVIHWDEYEQIERDYFDRMATQLEGLIQHHRQNLASLLEDGQTWLKNIRTNLPRIRHHKSPRAETFQGSVAVVGAGPSLDEQIDWLQSNRSNLTVCSINTAGPVLNAHGIQVDVHFAVDSDPEIHRDLLESNVKHVVASPNVSPGVFESFDSYTLFGLLSPLTNWLQSARFVPTIPSKSAAIPSFIEWLSRTPIDHIYLLGCDLGHRNGRFYARGTRREQIALKELNRFKHLPTWHLIEQPEDQEDPHFGQQKWVTLRSETSEQIQIPGPVPEWWNQPAVTEDPPETSPSLTFRTVDRSVVEQWADKQHQQLTTLLDNPHDASDPWQQFWFWVHKLTEDPTNELEAWKTQFSNLVSQ